MRYECVLWPERTEKNIKLKVNKPQFKLLKLLLTE